MTTPSPYEYLTAAEVDALRASEAPPGKPSLTDRLRDLEARHVRASARAERGEDTAERPAAIEADLARLRARRDKEATA